MSTPIPSLGNRTPEQLKVAELREELRKRGINGKGLKKDLVERLDEILRQEVAEANLSKATGGDYSDGVETGAAVASSVVEVKAVPTKAEASSTPVEPQTAVPELQVTPIEVGAVLLDECNPGPADSRFRAALPSLGNDFSADIRNHVLEEVALVPDLFSKDAATVGAVPDATVEDVSQGNFQTSGGKFHESALVSQSLPLEVPSEVEVIESGHIGDEKSPTGKTVDADYKLNSEDAMDTKAHDSMPVREWLLAMEASNEVAESESQVKSGRIEDGKPVAGKVFEAEEKVSSQHAMETNAPAGESCEVEFDVHCVQLRPYRSTGYLGPTVSTDGVISKTLDPAMSMENPFVAKAIQERADGKGRMKEKNPGEAISPEADSVVVETTVVVPETVLMDTAISISAPATGLEEASLTRGEDVGTSSVDNKEKVEFTEVQDRGRDDVVDVEPDPKFGDLKLMEIELDSSTGEKRREIDESRHVEPTKRQRRWNSEKSAGANADVKTSLKAALTGGIKEITPPEARGNTQAPVAQPPSTTASSTPKASASISSEKPSSSRPTISRIEVATNGELDKKRMVPPPSRSPTVSLKIDRFVRPFTIKAVRELLEQTGTVKEMWMDQIKTHCFVTYSSIAEAVSTRNALYNLQWPLAGGKLLVAEFVEPEEVKVRVEGLKDKPAATPVITPRASVSNNSQAAATTGLTPSAPTSTFPPGAPLSLPSRERPALLSKKDFESPIPTLDDLFKKTRVKPQIYFLPLNDEQVAAKLRTKQPAGKPPLRA